MTHDLVVVCLVISRPESGMMSVCE
jgi:hypothetical protein